VGPALDEEAYRLSRLERLTLAPGVCQTNPVIRTPRAIAIGRIHVMGEMVPTLLPLVLLSELLSALRADELARCVVAGNGVD